VRHPEVHDLHRAVVLDEDVRGLDVAVDDARLVRVREAREHLDDDGHLALERERRRLAHRLLEILTLQQLHRDEGRAVRVVAEVEDGHHVRVRHLRDGLRLALEALLQLGVVGDLRDHDLEGHVAVEHGVAGQVDLAHGALAEGADDVVLADPARKLLLDRLPRASGLSHAGVSGAQLPSSQRIRRQGLRGCQMRKGSAGWLSGPAQSLHAGGRGYLAVPVTLKWARLFFCQQSSLEAVQTGTSLP